MKTSGIVLAGVAQLVAVSSCNQKVAGSNPSPGAFGNQPSNASLALMFLCLLLPLPLKAMEKCPRVNINLKKNQACSLTTNVLSVILHVGMAEGKAEMCR